MSSSALSARTIGSVRGRFLLSTSDTRPRLPIVPDRHPTAAPLPWGRPDNLPWIW